MPPVIRLLAKRLGTSLIVLIGVSMLIFAIARVIPGDPARIALGPNATAEQVSSAARAAASRPADRRAIRLLRRRPAARRSRRLALHQPAGDDRHRAVPAGDAGAGLRLGRHDGADRPAARHSFGALPRQLDRQSDPADHAARRVGAGLRVGGDPDAALRLLPAAVPDRRAHLRHHHHRAGHRLPARSTRWSPAMSRPSATPPGTSCCRPSRWRCRASARRRG